MLPLPRINLFTSEIASKGPFSWVVRSSGPVSGPEAAKTTPAAAAASIENDVLYNAAAAASVYHCLKPPPPRRRPFLHLSNFRLWQWQRRRRRTRPPHFCWSKSYVSALSPSTTAAVPPLLIGYRAGAPAAVTEVLVVGFLFGEDGNCTTASRFLTRL